jgi:hypothetical protein
MHPADLARHVDDLLRRLPLPDAPATLLPRVMAAVQSFSQRPWYQRAWFTWPLQLQVAACVLLIATAASGVVALPAVAAAAHEWASSFGAPVLARADELMIGIAELMSAVRAVWNALIQPLLFLVSPLVALMCAACAAFGLGFSRFASGRA